MPNVASVIILINLVRLEYIWKSIEINVRYHSAQVTSLHTSLLSFVILLNFHELTSEVYCDSYQRHTFQ